MKKLLVIKESNTTLKLFKHYMIVTTSSESYVIAYRYLEEIYINKTVTISLSDVLRLAKIAKFYLIDHHGYVLANIRLENA